MFFILSKTLSFIIMPLTIITIIFLVGLVFNRQKWAPRWIIMGFVLLLFFSNQFLINEILKLWEYPPVKIDSMENYEAGIILGGLTNNEKRPQDRVHVNQSVERVLHTIRLYKEGVIENVIISGGSGKLFPEGPTEAAQITRILTNSGIPRQNIFLENQSRNTHENAVNTKKLVREKFNNPDLVLITSAFHMPRAIACFEKINMGVTPFSTDIKTIPRKFSPGFLLIPGSSALGKWELLIKEWGGMIAYKLAGYV